MDNKISKVDIDQYISQLKSGELIKKLETWILAGNLKEVILGEGSFSVTSKWDSGPVNPSFIVWVFHILVLEDKIKINEINKAFEEIEVNSVNVCILLKYYLSVIIHKKKIDKLINIDFSKIVEKINENFHEYKNKDCVNSLIEKISGESEGEIFFNTY